jgi:hypothetical protein
MTTEVSPKTGSKPVGNLESINVALGLKEPSTKGAEVTGHLIPPISPGMNYVCWNDGAINWVPPGYTSFICWHDGVLNV